MKNQSLFNQDAIDSIFENLITQESKHLKIIELGKKLPQLTANSETEECLVQGCQSNVYISYIVDDKGTMHFKAFADSLFASGLAALTLLAYHNMSPEDILLTPPTFIEKLKLHHSLSPGRSNGLLNMIRHIKNQALKVIMNKTKK